MDPLDELFPDQQESPPRRRRWPWILLSIVGVIALCVGVIAFALNQLARDFDDNVTALPSASAFPEETTRPADVTPDAQNILLVGSDLRGTITDDPDEIRGQRSDTIMVVHIPADGENIQVMSIMRDNWVSLPGYGEGKINAALAYGGAAYLVEVIENIIDVRIDHVAIVDFEGFEGVTDALGGVTLQNAQAFSSDGHTFAQGQITLTGEQALAYVRARYPFADGDYTRVRNQQAFLKGIVSGIFSTDTLTNPTRLYDVVSSLAQHMTVDEGLDSGYIVDLATSLSGIRPENIQFFTAPTLGTGMVGDQSVVFPDWDGLALIAEAFRTDTLDDYLATTGQ